MSDRQITLEHRQGSRVAETLKVGVDRAKELLAADGANQYHWVVRPPFDFATEYDDDARYADDCEALGIVNYYA